jgi:type VI secretion system protein ImpF
MESPSTQLNVRERLQPALLDRLIDDQPERAVDADDHRVMNKAALRAAVLRDLRWLFNAVAPAARTFEPGSRAADSVLNFGMPPMSGQLRSKVDLSWLERCIHEAIRRFEPRVLAETLEVRALEIDDMLASHNLVEFQIRGQLWAQPVPLDILLRTQFDLEAGQVEVRDAAAGSPRSARTSA